MKNLVPLLLLSAFLACETSQNMKETATSMEELQLDITNNPDFVAMTLIKEELNQRRVNFIRSSSEEEMKNTNFYVSIGFKDKQAFQDYLMEEYIPHFVQLKQKIKFSVLNKVEFTKMWRGAFENVLINQKMVRLRVSPCTPYINCLNEAWDDFDSDTNGCVDEYVNGGSSGLFVSCLATVGNNYDFNVGVCDDVHGSGCI